MPPDGLSRYGVRHVTRDMMAFLRPTDLRASAGAAHDHSAFQEAFAHRVRGDVHVGADPASDQPRW